MALLSFTGSPHGGTQKLLPEWQSEPRITPTTIIDHSIVGSGLGAYYYFRDQTSLESHFIVLKSGMIWQLMDTGRQADANYRANDFAISIETEDNGNPNTDPWTAAQLASLKWLHNKLQAVHSTIPRKKCTSEAGGGLGYHSLFGAPSDWTPVVGKTCPGKPVRVSQWNNVLLPAFISGSEPEEDDLTGDQDQRLKDVEAKLNKLYGIVVTSDPANNEIDEAVLAYRRLRAGVSEPNNSQANLQDITDRLVAIEGLLSTLTTPPPSP